MNTEKWKRVPFATRYYASTHGRIKSTDTVFTNCNGISQNRSGKILSQSSDGRYYQVALDRRLYKAHRVILTTFVGSPPSNIHQTNHIDGNRYNNWLNNLEWVTPRENINHSITVLGNKPNQIASSMEYRLKCFAIYKSFMEGTSINQLVVEFGYHPTTISKLITYVKKLIQLEDIPDEYSMYIQSKHTRSNNQYERALNIYTTFLTSNMSAREYERQMGISRKSIAWCKQVLDL